MHIDMPMRDQNSSSYCMALKMGCFNSPHTLLVGVSNVDHKVCPNNFLCLGQIICIFKLTKIKILFKKKISMPSAFDDLMHL